MVEKKVNYCQLLGLNPLKESTYTDEAIQKKIQAKKEKWTNDSRNKQNDPEQRFKSEKLVGMVDDIVRVMGDPMLRKREFLEGKTILKGKVQKLKSDCIVLSDGSYLVMPGITENYTKKLHWEGVTKADVVKLAEVKEGAPPKPVHDKAFNAFNSLRTVDTYTPIELLNTPTWRSPSNHSRRAVRTPRSGTPSRCVTRGSTASGQRSFPSRTPISSPSGR